MTTLDVKDLRVRYGSAVAVDGVSFTATPGTVTAIVGPNGAGKSSLFGAVYGSVGGTGEVAVDGRRVDSMSALQRVRRASRNVPQGRSCS